MIFSGNIETDVSKYITNPQEITIDVVNDNIDGFARYLYTYDCREKFVNFIDNLANIDFVLAGTIYNKTIINVSNELSAIINNFDENIIVRICTKYQSPEYNYITNKINNFEWNIDSDYDIKVFLDNPVIPEDLDEWPKIIYSLTEYLHEDPINRLKQIGELLYKILNINELFHLAVMKSFIKTNKKIDTLKLERDWLHKFDKYKKYETIIVEPNHYTPLNIVVRNTPVLSKNITSLLESISNVIVDKLKVKRFVLDILKTYKHYKYNNKRLILDQNIMNDPDITYIDMMIFPINEPMEILINDTEATLLDALKLLYIPKKNSEIELQKLVLMNI